MSQDGSVYNGEFLVRHAFHCCDVLLLRDACALDCRNHAAVLSTGRCRTMHLMGKASSRRNTGWRSMASGTAARSADTAFSASPMQSVRAQTVRSALLACFQVCSVCVVCTGSNHSSELADAITVAYCAMSPPSEPP